MSRRKQQPAKIATGASSRGARRPPHGTNPGGVSRHREQMAMDSQTLLQAFEHAQIVVDDDAVAELLSMAREHKAGATWMAESWEAFVMCAKNKKLHAKAGRSSMDQFRSYVVKHAPKPESQDGYRFTSSLELAEDDGTPPIFTRTPAPSRKSVGSRVEVSESPPEMAPSAAVAIELLPQVRIKAVKRSIPRDPECFLFQAIIERSRVC